MFFDSEKINKGYADDVRRLRNSADRYRALSGTYDRELLDYLRLSAIDHRRMLLPLGQNHNIGLHYVACMSMVEIITVLYLYWMNIDPKQPN